MSIEQHAKICVLDTMIIIFTPFSVKIVIFRSQITYVLHFYSESEAYLEARQHALDSAVAAKDATVQKHKELVATLRLQLSVDIINR